jgi:hypothetical protein
MKYLTGLMFVGLSTTLLLAQNSTPQLMKMQGFLTDNTGTPVSGTQTMTFVLYDASVGGAVMGTVANVPVVVSNGLYEVDLPLGSSAFSGATRYIEITVNAEVLSPRVQLVTAPFSYSADKLDGFEGADFVKKAGDSLSGPLQVAAMVESTTGGFKFPDGTIQTTATAGSNTLGQAYNQGGPGAGRTINANSGAVNITGSGGLTVNGSVGIGTTAPSGSLEISSNNPYPLKATTTDSVARFLLEGGLNSVIRASDLSTTKSLSLMATNSAQTGAFIQVDGKDKSGSSSTGSGVVLIESARQSPTGDIVFSTQGLHRAIIDQDGNVGIGTDNPGSHRLWVEQSSNTAYSAVFRNGGGSGKGVLIEGGVGGSTYDYPLMWVGNYAGTVPRFFVNGNGSVGINTATPTAALDVVGRTRTQDIQFGDGTVQTTASTAGAQGPPGEQGPPGVPGPAGPAVTTYCVNSAVPNDCSDSPQCSCSPGGTLLSTSRDYCTSDTGSCTAPRSGPCPPDNQYQHGQCCVCKPN